MQMDRFKNPGVAGSEIHRDRRPQILVWPDAAIRIGKRQVMPIKCRKYRHPVGLDNLINRAPDIDRSHRMEVPAILVWRMKRQLTAAAAAIDIGLERRFMPRADVMRNEDP